ncbi:DUF3995 domain-containing protein [Mangrovivirga cuniculi]|uniref:DUF3995 domain-containing protein n=1 Tax=Mangrovivirga cuniculi TaxID=2715131 RepID=A0A4D7K8T6_9BACT|nr:DUF3995 domain-containing protein [Mangrovivirga cuniculi]QCK15698.1 DUF3995 domain-containing protein [Mangrovivirga cuniculi]
MTLPLTLSFIFLILGLIHLNWVIGGEFGFAQSLPTKENGERVLNPKKADSAIVGLGLIFFSLFYIFKSGMIDHQIPQWVMKYGGWIIPAIFLLRAIGDFRYVGFFKKVRTTEFGKLDTKLFSPLCLVIGIVGIIIQLN